MSIKWVGSKCELANHKHFNGALTADQMNMLVRKVISNATHVGISDRCNGNHMPTRILWGDYAGTKYAVVLDGAAVKRNEILVVSFYDIKPSTIESKAKRFGMKETKKG